MERIYDRDKQDIALYPRSLATTTATGEYFDLSKTNTVAFPFIAGNMAVTNTVVAQLLQATDHLGTGSKNITGATATITANVNVQQATITLATFTAGSVVVINGITFTAHATTTTPANREFSIAGTDTQDAVELVSLINNATYGVPNVYATSALGVVTLVCTDPGTSYISVTGVAVIGVAATVKAIGYIEIPSGLLDVNNGFTHVALKLTTVGTIICSGNIIRDRSRYTEDQYLSASYLG